MRTILKTCARPLQLLVVSAVAVSSAFATNDARDYLRLIGAPPLRFQSHPAETDRLLLPPLDMGNTPGSDAISGGTGDVANIPMAVFPEPVSINTLTTNNAAAGQVALVAPAVASKPTNEEPVGSAVNPVGSNNDSALSPQMLVHFFRKSGTNTEQAVTVPLTSEPANTAVKSSSATYTSP